MLSNEILREPTLKEMEHADIVIQTDRETLKFKD